jgi:hypothetical protein
VAFAASYPVDTGYRMMVTNIFGKDVEGIGQGFIGSISAHLPGGTKEIH